MVSQQKEEYLGESVRRPKIPLHISHRRFIEVGEAKGCLRSGDKRGRETEMERERHTQSRRQRERNRETYREGEKENKGPDVRLLKAMGIAFGSW